MNTRRHERRAATTAAMVGPMSDGSTHALDIAATILALSASG